MRTGTLMVDNFYADPAAVRRYALAQSYYYPYEQGNGLLPGQPSQVWMATRFKTAKECPFKSNGDLIAALERITGERVDRSRWHADFPIDDAGRPQPGFLTVLDRSCLWNCSFHVILSTPHGHVQDVHDHAVDGWNGVDIDGWTGVVDLSPNTPAAGGIRLWRHGSSGGQVNESRPGVDVAQLIDEFGKIPNRLILCRGSIPHTAVRGWGDTMKNGRLFQTFFFRTVRSAKVTSVQIPV
jgi:hypothetical protein